MVEFKKTKIPFFRRFVLQNFPFIEEDFDALTDYALICKVIEYLNKVIDSTNYTTEQMAIVTDAFNTLKDYVDHYFENLDVQDEINNKVDQLVADGTLQRILNSPATTENLGGVIVGDGLQIDENGKLDVKAGSNITVDENGVSETPYQNYLDITANVTRYVNNDTNTLIHYSIIPSSYKPMMAMSDPENPNVAKRANEVDYIYKTTLMTNMSPWDTSNHITYGPLIIDHEVKIQNNLGSGTGWTRPLVGIDDNGRMHNINGSTPASEVNMKFASRAWYTLYNDGETNPDLADMTERNPRTFVGQDYDGNYIVGVCGGRQAEDTGMTYGDIVDFVRNQLSFNARVLWGYDGGGSSAFLYHGIRQNRLVEREDRACPTWLYWTSPTAKHPGMFKNQSITSLELIQREIDEDGHIQNKAGMDALNTAGNERITINTGSRYMIVNPRTVVYNLNFQITGEGNLASYSDLFKNLPRTDSNYYFMALKHSDYSQVPVYITSMEGVDKSRIRSLRAMEPGTYSIHFAVQCNTQY